MVRPVRLTTALLALLFARDVSAQVEVAPRPHWPVAPEPQVALEELVRECRTLGVRLPPANTQLVRAGYDAKTFFPQLLFRNPLPANGARSVTYHDGAELEYNKHIFKTYDRPTPADLDGLHYDFLGWLKLAVKFRSRGWDEAARAALDRARAAAVTERKDGEPPLNLLRTVRMWALYQWADEFCERDSDRRNAVRRIRAILGTDPVLEATYRSYLADVERTIAPRQSKPGSVEALIDDLTDFWEDPKDRDNKRGQEAYDKLYDLGFESVPALIEHLADRRFTRARSGGIMMLHIMPYQIRVGGLVSSLLNGLSGDEILLNDESWLIGGHASPEVARAWWARARAFGEENWLLECVLPREDWTGSCPPCERALHLIAKRYPHRLPALYQTLLLKRGDVQSELFVRAITSSTLPKSRKIELLTAGATNRFLWHAVEALDGLYQLDAKVFAESWLAAFNRVPENFWQSEYSLPPLRLIRFVLKTDDPRCWDALATRTARLSPDGRAKMISAFDDPLEATKGPRLYLRYLLSHVTDHAPASCWDLLGFRVFELTVSESATRALDSALEVDLWSAAQSTKSPRERSLLRALVRDRAELELLRLERP